MPKSSSARLMPKALRSGDPRVDGLDIGDQNASRSSEPRSWMMMPVRRRSPLDDARQVESF